MSTLTLIALAVLADNYGSRLALAEHTPQSNNPSIGAYLALFSVIGPPAVALPLFFISWPLALLVLVAWPVGVLAIFGGSI